MNANKQNVNNIAGNGLKVARLDILSAQVLQLNTTPQLLIAAPGAGKYIEIIQCSCGLTYNSVAYATTSGVQLITDTAAIAQFIISPILNAVASTIRTGQFVSASGTSDTQCLENKAIYVKAPSADPTSGNSNIVVYACYREVTI